MTELAPAGTRYSVSVLTTHTVDSSPSLLVAFENQRYLFGTPEGFSRIALQNKVGLRKVGHVFLGDLAQSGGLPGFLLTSVEAGNDKIKVFGPRGTDHLLASCRFFTRRDKLSLQVTSPPPTASTSTATLPEPLHADSNLIVYAFPLSASGETFVAETTAMQTDDATPRPPSADDHTSPNGSLKRKRSSTSPSPPRRVKSPPASPTFAPTSASFNPSRLRGEDAVEWRKLVLRDMFRGSAFEPAPTLPPVDASGRRPQTPAYLPQPLPPLPRDFTPDALSYLVVGPRLRGKFLPEKARALGVKPGKAFSRLIAGERVWVPAVSTQSEEQRTVGGKDEQGGKKESKKERAERMKRQKAAAEAAEAAAEGAGDGRWVEAGECMEAGQDGTAFLVLNIPTPAHLAALASTIPPARLSTESLGSYVAFRGVFLYIGPSVITSPVLESYLSTLRTSFPALTVHVSSADFVGEGKNEITFGPASLLSLRLRQLDEQMFPLPHYSFLPPDAPPPPSLPTDMSILAPNSHFSSTLAPLPAEKSPFGTSARTFEFDVPSPQADAEAARLKGPEKPVELQQRAAVAWSEYVQKAEEAKEAVARQTEDRQSRTAEDGLVVPASEGSLVVTPLGTGSAVPSKYRNVSGTLLHLPREDSTAPTQYILLDAGEGTWGQIARRFGEDGGREGKDSAEDVLRGIKMVFLSHLHQDHHAGMSIILKKRAQLDPPPQDPLVIVAPPNARIYLVEQHQLFDLGLDHRSSTEPGRRVHFVDNFLVEPGKTLLPGSKMDMALEGLKQCTGLTEITAVPVLHRCRAWGAVITHVSGWRTVFSGDTMPCEALVSAGQGASVLVHEATIEDDMPDVAQAKGHSTFGQAIDIATRMRARHLLLTHFSARYPKLPPLSTASASSDLPRPTVATAFDLMTLRLDEFWKVEQYRDAMDALLSWDEAEDRNDGDELSGKERTLGTSADDEAMRDKAPAKSKKQQKRDKKEAEVQLAATA
ncbi:ribonuclease Z [Rhodotorula paludigena]|uniref:ribonuclease Z n=1 Tax=Rhodotorula paludigena TaxID=86838 RepID=UPI0031821FBD